MNWGHRPRGFGGVLVMWILIVGSIRSLLSSTTFCSVFMVLDTRHQVEFAIKVYVNEPLDFMGAGFGVDPTELIVPLL